MKLTKVIGTIVTSSFLISLAFNSSNQIITNSKEYFALNDSKVSTRELAILASLVYEDVPARCVNKGSISSNCFYESKDIIGMSEEKAKSLVSDMTLSLVEPGEAYYYLNYTNTKQMKDAGWIIYDYATESVKGKTKDWLRTHFPNSTKDFKAAFDVVTFKKGNNYVIAYRGTDFPDLFEWIDDFFYSINGQHSEASMAYIYAQDIYERILGTDKNAKIYVTGHSLGAYLAQVGGAAIVDKEAGVSYKNGIKSNEFNKINDYTNFYKIKSSHLEQVAYFNGMGAGGLIRKDSTLMDNVQDALIYLSTHDKSGNLVKSGRNLNYSENIKSSGRLVLYSMDQDPISYIGFHLGEIFKLETAADSITNHRGNHSITAQGIQDFINNNFENVASDTDSLFEKWFGKDDKKTYGQTLSEGIIDALVSSKQLEEAIGETGEVVSETGDGSNNFPTLVKTEIKKSYGVDVGNINLVAMLSNLLKGGGNYIDKYGLLTGGSSLIGVIDFFNINHETDSFACLIDSSGAGVVKNVKLSILSNDSGVKCIGNECYYKGLYSDKLFSLSADKKTNTSKFFGNNLVLKASVEGACAKSYQWQYSLDGKNWKTLATTTDNRFIIPANLTNKTLKFRVNVEYGDSFQETKTYFEDNKLMIGHGNSRKTIYTGNPTLNDGVSVQTVSSVDKTQKKTTSNIINVSVVGDNTKPDCKFSNDAISVKLSCKWFSCKSSTVNLQLTCSDSKSGMSSVEVTEAKANQGGFVLIPSISLSNSYPQKLNGKNIVTTFSVTATRKPSWNKPYITIKGNAIDKMGNKTTFSKKLYVNISK